MTSRTISIIALATLLTACTTAGSPPPPVHDSSAETRAEEEVPQTVEDDAEVEEPRQADLSSIRISIAAVGDMMLGSDYPEKRLPDGDGRNFLAAVSPFLNAVDFAVGNLEGVLADDGSPKKNCDNPNACYLFRSPTRYAQHYRDAGFDALSLANNHARDFGEQGRSSSMQALSDVDILHSGRAGTYAVRDIDGLSVSFIAYSVTQKSNLLHDYDVAFATIAEHAETYDIVIVSFHGGAEGANVMRLPFAEETYFGEPRGDVVRFARGAIDAGADLVFGHGPHVVRAMERYKQRLIAYSLGNFATYYGISVSGNKGIAPIITATLDGNGVFIEGEVISTKQIRPRGPSIDKDRTALKQLRSLSMQDFDQPGLRFAENGKLFPAPRESIKAHPLVVAPN